ncbi:MAG: hypothetical protein H7Y88_11745, partial [Phycisphaerales bacterium]|nr:hypothetical protein [Phycisphaerales bacterium]
AAVMLIAGAAAGAAHAQPAGKATEPYYAVVTADNVLMKAGAGLPYYGVKTLKAGTIVRVDGAMNDWVRVQYLPGMSAFVKAEEATVDGSTVTLAKPTRLMAANSAGGERGNWWFLLENDLPTGTKFATSETLKTADGRVYGYLVAAPAEARGFLKPEAIRPATPQEAAAHEKEMGIAPAKPAETKPAGTRPAEAKPTPATNPPAGATDPNKPAATGIQSPAGTIPIPVEPGGATTTPAQPTTTPTQPVLDPAANPAGEAPVEEGGTKPIAPPADTAENRQLASIDSLASLYEEARTKPIREAEVDSVIAEFNRVLGELGTTPEDQRTADFLRARLEVLKIRQDLQTSLQSAADANQRFEKRGDVVAQQMATLNRIYALVGKLAPSTVYDGKRLPLMYRIISVDAGFPRTLGYVAGRAELEIEGKIGRVVGVVGKARYDDALRLNIVAPERVDLLSPPAANTGGAPTQPASPAGDGARPVTPNQPR